MKDLAWWRAKLVEIEASRAKAQAHFNFLEGMAQLCREMIADAESEGRPDGSQ